MNYKVKRFWLPKPPINYTPHFNCFFCKERFEGDGILVNPKYRNFLIRILLKSKNHPFHIPVEILSFVKKFYKKFGNLKKSSYLCRNYK